MSFCLPKLCSLSLSRLGYFKRYRNWYQPRVVRLWSWEGNHGPGRKWQQPVVAWLTAMWEDSGSSPTAGSCVYHNSHCDILYSLGYGLHAVTAVPKSTQPSTLHWMVKWVSAFRLSNNTKWWLWMWMVAACRQTHTPHAKSVGLVWGLAAIWRSVCIPQINQVNSCNVLTMMTAL